MHKLLERIKEIKLGIAKAESDSIKLWVELNNQTKALCHTLQHDLGSEYIVEFIEKPGVFNDYKHISADRTWSIGIIKSAKRNWVFCRKEYFAFRVFNFLDYIAFRYDYCGVYQYKVLSRAEFYDKIVEVLSGEK